MTPAEIAELQTGDLVLAECFGDGDGHDCTAQIVRINTAGTHATLRCPETNHPDWTVEL